MTDAHHAGSRRAQPTAARSRRACLQVLAALTSLLVFRPGHSRAATPPLRIGVIGAGWLGGTVARQWLRAGHEVMFSARDLDRVKADIANLGPLASAGTPMQAAQFGAVLLFAVPYDALPELGHTLAASIHGKIVLDACNPSPSSADALTREAESIGVGALSSRLLPGARLVRAFSAVDATAIEASASQATGKLGVPLASDDREALHVAAGLVRDAGCEPVVVGDLAAARTFQRGGPGFRANTSAPALRKRLGLAADA